MCSIGKEGEMSTFLPNKLLDHIRGFNFCHFHVFNVKPRTRATDEKIKQPETKLLLDLYLLTGNISDE